MLSLEQSSQGNLWPAHTLRKRDGEPMGATFDLLIVQRGGWAQEGVWTLACVSPKCSGLKWLRKVDRGVRIDQQPGSGALAPPRVPRTALLKLTDKSRKRVKLAAVSGRAAHARPSGFKWLDPSSRVVRDVITRLSEMRPARSGVAAAREAS